MASQKAVMPPEAAEKPDRAGAPKTEETPLEAFASLCVIAVLGLYLFTFLAQHFVIPSGSMEKTLLIGDHLVVDRITLAPPASWMPLVRYREVRHGDIIVFFKPGEPDLYLVKRVIGIPGDHIHLRDGVLYVNGAAQNEPYKFEDPAAPQLPYAMDFPAVPPDDTVTLTPEWKLTMSSHIEGDDGVVPQDSYFAMGDNRENSWDSRFWGFVPKETLIGRPMFIYWSFETPEDPYAKQDIGDRLGFIFHIVLHFFDQTRWSRMFRLVH
jgi:signal peptidase I